MKKEYFLAILIVILNFSLNKSNAQETHYVEINLGVKGSLKSFCSDSEELITITDGYGLPLRFQTGIKLVYDDYCYSSNVSLGCGQLIFEGPGVVVSEIVQEGPFICEITLKVRPPKSSSSEINYNFEYSADLIFDRPISCGTKREEKVVWSGEVKIHLNQTPAVPVIIADKDVVEIGENAKLSIESSGCDNYSSYQFARAETVCDGSNPTYTESEYRHGQGSHYFSSSIPKTITYKARCKNSECESPYSAPKTVRVIQEPSVPRADCNLGEKDKDQYDSTADDYHRYQVAEKICDKSDPGCTVSSVYNLLKSRKEYAVPQYLDFRDNFNTLIRLGLYIPSKIRPGSPLSILEGVVSTSRDIVEKDAQLPVMNCQETGEYSPSSIGFILKPPILFNLGAFSNMGLLWDPIVQTIDENSHTITNFTQPGHALHPGKVMISVQEDDCSVYVQVIGMGNSDSKVIPEILSTKVNVYFGEVAFTSLLERLKKAYESE